MPYGQQPYQGQPQQGFQPQVLHFARRASLVSWRQNKCSGSLVSSLAAEASNGSEAHFGCRGALGGSGIGTRKRGQARRGFQGVHSRSDSAECELGQGCKYACMDSHRLEGYGSQGGYAPTNGSQPGQPQYQAAPQYRAPPSGHQY